MILEVIALSKFIYLLSQAGILDKVDLHIKPAGELMGKWHMIPSSTF